VTIRAGSGAEEDAATAGVARRRASDGSRTHVSGCELSKSRKPSKEMTRWPNVETGSAFGQVSERLRNQRTRMEAPRGIEQRTREMIRALLLLRFSYYALLVSLFERLARRSKKVAESRESSISARGASTPSLASGDTSYDE